MTIQRRLEIKNNNLDIILDYPVGQLHTIRYVNANTIVVRDTAKELLLAHPISDVRTTRFIDKEDSEPLVPPVEKPEPPPIPVPPIPVEMEVVARYGLNVRNIPHTKDNTPIAKLPTGQRVLVEQKIVDDPERETYYQWRKLIDPHPGKYCAEFSPLTTFLEPIDIASGSPTVQLTGELRLADRFDSTWLDNGLGVGWNGRSWLYWGSEYPAMSRADWHSYLDYMASHGFRWIRVYFSHNNHSLDTSLALLGEFLDLADDFGIRVMVVVNDSLGLSGHYIGEDRAYHNATPLGHLNASYYRQRPDGSYPYEAHYLPRLRKLCQTFKDHNAFWAVSLINEPGIYGETSNTENAQNVVDLIRKGSEIVHAETNGRVVCLPGWINTFHVKPANKLGRDWAFEVYGQLPKIHMASIHLYIEKGDDPRGLFRFEADSMAMDVQACKHYRKAWGVTESGVHRQHGYRADIMQSFITRMVIHNHASVVLGWEFSKEIRDTNICDSFGWALYRDGDYEDTINEFSEWPGVYQQYE